MNSNQNLICAVIVIAVIFLVYRCTCNHGGMEGIVKKNENQHLTRINLNKLPYNRARVAQGFQGPRQVTASELHARLMYGM